MVNAATTGKKLRYAACSLFFLVAAQAIVQVLHFATTWPDAISVLLAGCVLSLPAYSVNRRFVWLREKSPSERLQVTAFWTATMLGTGLALSFAAVAEVITAQSSAVYQSTALVSAQLAGGALVWIGRYVFLDRILFRAEPQPAQIRT